jgi:hypothetical protein
MSAWTVIARHSAWDYCSTWRDSVWPGRTAFSFSLYWNDCIAGIWVYWRKLSRTGTSSTTRSGQIRGLTGLVGVPASRSGFRCQPGTGYPSGTALHRENVLKWAITLLFCKNCLSIAQPIIARIFLVMLTGSIRVMYFFIIYLISNQFTIIL